MMARVLESEHARLGTWSVVFVAAALLTTKASALEERFDDLSASVEVAPVFSFSLDNPNLAFGAVSPNEMMILGEHRYFNEVRCRSNSGRSWSVNAQLLSLKHLTQDFTLAPANLQWNVVESTGEAQPSGGLHTFQPFQDQPVLIYTSQGADTRGREVILRFQYRLSAPPNALAGSYAGQIVFTMTETL